METAYIQKENIFEFSVDDEAKSHLAGASQWMLINAVVSLVALAASVINTIVMYNKFGSLPGQVAGYAIVQLLVTVVISLAVNITLIQTASNLKKGLAMTDQGFFNQGLFKLASYYKIIGILLIIILAFFLLAIFATLLRF